MAGSGQRAFHDLDRESYEASRGKISLYETFNELILNCFADILADNYAKQVCDRQAAISVLDLGCGDGQRTARFRHVLQNRVARGQLPRISRVLGIDISSEKIGIARSTYGDPEVGRSNGKDVGSVTFEVASMEHMEYGEDSMFDVATCLFSLQAVQDVSRVARQVASILNPHGKIMLLVPLDNADLVQLRRNFMKDKDGELQRLFFCKNMERFPLASDIFRRDQFDIGEKSCRDPVDYLSAFGECFDEVYRDSGSLESTLSAEQFKVLVESWNLPEVSF